MSDSLAASSFQSLHLQADTPGRVLVLDSGVGGLSVQREIKQALPEAGLLYLADRAAFPYGDWDAGELCEHLSKLVRSVSEAWSPSAVVVACNTASTLVLESLRSFLKVPVVGTVPAIKPAAQQTRSGVFAVLATPGTVKRDYTQDMIVDFAPDHHIALVGASGLAALAEDKMAGRGVDLGRLKQEIAPCFVEKDGQRTDCVVLGCTHYPFLQEEMARIAPWPVTWIDPAPAIARRLAQVVDKDALAIGCDDLFFVTN
ncbi:Glutamate racemase [Pseudovibrio axinellae]|uniref:Glutamate racemase n=1 Tax=Pseudovibrio axinellae TaxID=989403 RepID=A0A166AMT1_9HYPH|nr:glutamate racemase [Pseudovibrio axinellae]KZL21320.1 Glutamate racemase [Pseudovibrio axinellae]SEQ95991.1 glutamate racemase [Pseudovibrio axinellae]